MRIKLPPSASAAAGGGEANAKSISALPEDPGPSFLILLSTLASAPASPQETEADGSQAQAGATDQAREDELRASRRRQVDGITDSVQAAIFPSEASASLETALPCIFPGVDLQSGSGQRTLDSPVGALPMSGIDPAIPGNARIAIAVRQSSNPGSESALPTTNWVSLHESGKGVASRSSATGLQADGASAATETVKNLAFGSPDGMSAAGSDMIALQDRAAASLGTSTIGVSNPTGSGELKPESAVAWITRSLAETASSISQKPGSFPQGGSAESSSAGVSDPSLKASAGPVPATLILASGEATEMPAMNTATLHPGRMGGWSAQEGGSPIPCSVRMSSFPGGDTVAASMRAAMEDSSGAGASNVQGVAALPSTSAAAGLAKIIPTMVSCEGVPAASPNAAIEPADQSGEWISQKGLAPETAEAAADPVPAGSSLIYGKGIAIVSPKAETLYSGRNTALPFRGAETIATEDAVGATFPSPVVIGSAGSCGQTSVWEGKGTYHQDSIRQVPGIMSQSGHNRETNMSSDGSRQMLIATSDGTVGETSPALPAGTPDLDALTGEIQGEVLPEFLENPGKNTGNVSQRLPRLSGLESAESQVVEMRHRDNPVSPAPQQTPEGSGDRLADMSLSPWKPWIASLPENKPTSAASAAPGLELQGKDSPEASPAAGNDAKQRITGLEDSEPLVESGSRGRGNCGFGNPQSEQDSSGREQGRPAMKEASSRMVLNILKSGEAITHPARSAGMTETQGVPVLDCRDPEFVSRLAAGMRVEVSRGMDMIRIQLRPAGMGTLEIRAEKGVDGLIARIQTESLEISSQLERSIPSLEKALCEQGLRMEKIDVLFDPSGIGQSLGQSFQKHGSDADRSQTHTNRSRTDLSSADEAITAAGERAIEIAAVGPNSTFHTVA